MVKFLESVIFVVFFLSSCSLNYGKNGGSESGIPEILSVNAQFSRIENGKTRIKAEISQLEQYKEQNISYAKDVVFSTFSQDGDLENQGKCTLVESDSANKKHTMLDDIYIENFPRKIKITANNLQWNEKTEQLVSGKDEKVTIEREDVFLSGIGFSASAVSNSFKFEKKLQGHIETKKQTADEDENKTE